MRFFKQPEVEPLGFVVIDVETTGLYPSKDRVVEIAAVHMDADGNVFDEFCTLVDPRRDVGPTSIHGITAADVRGAPTFEQAVASIWSWLSRRVVVAHNVSFDVRFLSMEFDRCGVRMPEAPVMCTMQLAAQYLHNLPARSLSACCTSAGIELSRHHSALDDARAAAELLRQFRAMHLKLPESWSMALGTASLVSWTPCPDETQFTPVTRAQQVERRANERAPLAAVVDRLPRGWGGDLDAYLGVLDRVLEDRLVTDDEIASLLELAAELGLTREVAEEAHLVYIRHVAAVAQEDGIVTSGEREDLLSVARLLGIAPHEALSALDEPQAVFTAPLLGGGTELQAGDRVVFTGDMETSRSEMTALATRAGLRVTSAVSGKTAVLVAADPYSQSGKAKTARELGVRVVAEHVFLQLVQSVGS